MRLLLKRGADPNGRDSRGFAGLDYAAGSHNLEAARLLLARGARVKPPPPSKSYVQQFARRLRCDGKLEKLRPSVAARLAQRLSGFPRRDFKILTKNQIHLTLADDRCRPKGGYPGEQKWLIDCHGNSAGGWYRRDVKEVVVAKDWLGTAVHELGHALDDALELDTKKRGSSSTNVVKQGSADALTPSNRRFRAVEWEPRSRRQWVASARRQAEIANILGLSQRTVEKSPSRSLPSPGCGNRSRFWGYFG